MFIYEVQHKCHRNLLVTSEIDGNRVRCHHEVRPTNEQKVPNYRAFMLQVRSVDSCGAR